MYFTIQTIHKKCIEKKKEAAGDYVLSQFDQFKNVTYYVEKILKKVDNKLEVSVFEKKQKCLNSFVFPIEENVIEKLISFCRK